MKPKLFIWSDFLVPTGFGIVAENLFKDLHNYYEVSILGINYFGNTKYDTSKYFVYPVTKEDPLGGQKLCALAQAEKPDVIFLFQDIFHISEIIPELKKVLPNTKIVSYFPIDGTPPSVGWQKIFEHSSAVVAYTDWAIEILKDTYEIKIPIHKLYHGVNETTFYPLPYDKIQEIRKDYKWANKFAVCNVNRFQPRKFIPGTARAFSMFAKGYKVCKCGNHMPINRKKCDLNMCPESDIVEVVKRNRRDVYLYLHMMSAEMTMGPGAANLLQNHLLNAGFVDSDTDGDDTILGVNARNIYSGEVPSSEINKIYNASNINISSTIGEGKLNEGTLILCRDGYKRIEHVTPEDEVINDEGNWSKVKKTLGTPFDGKIYSITMDVFSKPILCSHDHPFLLKDKSYKRAELLNVGDIVALRRPKWKNKIPTQIDLADMGLPHPNYEITDTQINSKQRRSSLQRFIPINAEILKFFGIFLGCGHVTDRGIMFNFKHRKAELFEYVDYIFNKYFNVEGSYDGTYSDQAGYVRIAAKPLLKLFRHLFGEKASERTIPTYFLALDKELRGELLNGIMSDVIHGQNTLSYEVKSEEFAYLLRDLYLSTGLLSFIREENYKYIITLVFDQTSHSNIEMDKEFVYLPIESISSSDEFSNSPKFLGYDLEVPNGESYTCAQVTVHNCGLSLIEAAATGTPSIAPKNSAIPEMLGDTGHIVPNLAIFNMSMDNGHLRPVVDPFEMMKALDIEYKKWKESDKEKDINLECIKNVETKFRWEDKREALLKILKEV
jgi:glycosyltransferase involved in cell wall biosynthesis